MKIVLDTNCILQVISRTAKHRWLYDLIKNGDLELAVTSDILLEYEEQLADFFSPVVANGVLKQLNSLDNVHYLQVYFYWNLTPADPDDNKFSDCAFAASADYLITYDKHFRVLAKIDFPKVTCLTIEEFKEVLNEKHGFSIP